jgi:hypothetical protein
MAKTPARQPKAEAQINAEISEGGPVSSPQHTPLERMTDLTRRVLKVPKSELPAKTAKGKRKRR